MPSQVLRHRLRIFSPQGRFVEYISVSSVIPRNTIAGMDIVRQEVARQGFLISMQENWEICEENFGHAEGEDCTAPVSLVDGVDLDVLGECLEATLQDFEWIDGE